MMYQLRHEPAAIVPVTLEPGAIMPTRATSGSAAFDLFALEEVTISSDWRPTKVRTGLRLGLPVGWHAKLLLRSSAGTKLGLVLANGTGLIDADYRGEVMAFLVLRSALAQPCTLRVGERFAQLLIERTSLVALQRVEELDETERGEGGFGSTGWFGPGALPYPPGSDMGKWITECSAPDAGIGGPSTNTGDTEGPLAPGLR